MFTSMICSMNNIICFIIYIYYYYLPLFLPPPPLLTNYSCKLSYYHIKSISLHQTNTTLSPHHTTPHHTTQHNTKLKQHQAHSTKPTAHTTRLSRRHKLSSFTTLRATRLYLRATDKASEVIPQCLTNANFLDYLEIFWIRIFLKICGNSCI